MRARSSILVLGACVACVAACITGGAADASEAGAPDAARLDVPLAADAALAAPDPDTVFGAYLHAPFAVANGFDVPAGEPCGDACWTGDTRDVSAVAHGRVVAVTPESVTVEHLWYDDQVKRAAWIRWEGVTPAVVAGQELRRGDPIGTASTLRAVAPAELGPVAAFLAGRPRLPVPQDEPVLALVSHDLKQMRVYQRGAVAGTYSVAFGQEEGDKERRGDNRTPKGVYRVVARSKGPFDGPYGAYFGGHWIKLDYPNPWDAARGVDAGVIDTATQRAITRAWWDRRLPPQNTDLGGGIGLHGWASEWSDDGPRGLSWGCVVLHLSDVGAIYDALPEGTMVVLF